MNSVENEIPVTISANHLYWNRLGLEVAEEQRRSNARAEKNRQQQASKPAGTPPQQQPGSDRP